MLLNERMRIEQTTDEEDLRRTALRLFHELWGRDKEHPDYDKGSWCALQLCLNRLGVKV